MVRVVNHYSVQWRFNVVNRQFSNTSQNRSLPVTLLHHDEYCRRNSSSNQQFPAVREDRFASVYLEVRQELQEATVLHNQDPLGTILHQLSKPGFFCSANRPRPHVVRKTVQPTQQRRHEAVFRRMNKSAATATAAGMTAPDLTQRRQPNRSSIWNSVIDAGGLEETTATATTKQSASTSNDNGSSSNLVSNLVGTGTRKHPH
jgi:hypothetical protein